MKRPLALTLAAAGLALAGCTASLPRTGPVDVSRYHLAEPLARTGIAVAPGGAESGPEYQLHADAVAVELARIGFARSAGNADYTALVSFRRESAGSYRTRPPLTIGLGTGGFSGDGGGGVGVGVGGSFGIGARTYEMVRAELFVQLKRRGDGVVVWEGRAHTIGPGIAPEMQPAEAAPRLAQALFRDFPGESGITITVP